MKPVLQHVPIPWYRREDYAALLALFKDADKLPRRFEDWLAKAEQLAQGLAARGMRVHRIIVEPEAFAAWCRAEQLGLDADARVRFANHAAAQIIAKEEAESK